MLQRKPLVKVVRSSRGLRRVSLYYGNASKGTEQAFNNTKVAEETRNIPIRYQPSSGSFILDTIRYATSSGRVDSTFKPPPKIIIDGNEEKPPPLYKYHIPTNTFQKVILSVGAATAAILDPRRADMVAVLGETTGYDALSKLFSKMIQDTEGQKILLDKPRINSSSLDLNELSKLPEGTLGHAYIKFLDDNQVTPDSRLPVQFVDDPELAYIMQRYREAHDLFHTVLGMPTNMLGEVTVKWVEGIQTGLPMCVGGAIFGPLRFKPKQRQKYLSTYLPWAIRVGKSSKLLMNVYFEKRWEQSLAELRQELGIEEPPI
ncbi:ubiquinone biosynthesis protein COQ4 homolog, mitochondrial-like [Palaemon carinicauda]|uniref:ubiquinone biosynthesis protein COQ4 homolog, mitochondrial-like n=1 Tax=Palaemon carinicauda TaxID=392227 RepID=UPI0035B68889